MSQPCIKCAKCNPICPTFLETRDEVYAPRGYLHLCELIDLGRLERSEEILEVLRVCTQCKLCEPLCPIDLPIVEIIRSHLL